MIYMYIYDAFTHTCNILWENIMAGLTPMTSCYLQGSSVCSSSVAIVAYV